MYNESQLIAALKNDNHEAFKQLYENYKLRIYSFILKMIPSKDEAQEIFQQVFVKIWENRTNINDDLSFNAYIYTIARNEAYSYWRKCLNKRQLENYLNIRTDYPHASVEKSVMDNDTKSYLFSLLKYLPKRRREVFVLRYIHYMSYKEIAVKLNISEHTVDNQIQKALSFIRKNIDKERYLLYCLLILLCI